MSAALQTKTFKVSMWMRKFKSYTWKRTWLWSTSQEIARLDLGPMTSQERETAITTVDRQERNGFVQLLPDMFATRPVEYTETQLQVVFLVMGVPVHHLSTTKPPARSNN